MQNNPKNDSVQLSLNVHKTAIRNRANKHLPGMGCNVHNFMCGDIIKAGLHINVFEKNLWASE